MKGASDMALLELKNVHISYGVINALKGISITVDQGEIVTLIGSNGAGKSTTLLGISGLMKPKEGEISFDGQRIDMLPPHEIAAKGIGHAPEGRRIFPRLTVQENLMMGAYRLSDRKLIRETLDQVFTLFPRLRERQNQSGGTLSGGEQQMLAIGRTLMMSPRILLLDEPSMGLSPVLVEQIFATIKEMNQAGITILLVEQNAYQALQVANRGYVIQTGTIVLDDTAANLSNNEMVRKKYLGED
jgi:branched-chain amino acid transport system ATP-binding protein